MYGWPIMNKQPANIKLSNFQIWAIILGSSTAFGHFVFVHLAIRFAGRDAWISLIMASFIGIIILQIQLKLAVAPNKTLVEHALNVFGKWVGSLVAGFYILFFMCIVAITIKVVSDFMEIVYPTTPPGIFLFAEFLVAAWVVQSGVEVLGRTIQILLPVLIFIGIGAFVLSTKDKDMSQLLPVFNQGLYPIDQGIFVFIVMFSELIAFSMITDTAVEFKKLPKQGWWFGVVMMVMFLGPVTGPVMVFGDELAKNLSFPTYTEIQYVRVSNIIERLDILGVVLWTIGSFFRISFYMFAAVKGVAQLFQSERESTFLIPVFLLTAGLSLSLMQSSREEVYYFLGSTYLFLSSAICIGLPLLTGLVAVIRKQIG